MRSILVGSALCALVCCVVGCAAVEPSSSESTEHLEGVADPLADNVDVQADRLIFTSAARAAGGDKLGELVARIHAYESEYRAAVEAAPASARVSADATDAWAVESLRGRQLAPVVLVGRRNSAALKSDGSIDTSVKNPNGYLRRAIAVSEGQAGEVIIQTRPSNLVEAHEELARLGMVEVREGEDDGWVFERNYPFNLADIDLNRTLYEKQMPAGLGTVRIGFKESYLRVSGNLDARAHGKWARLRDAHAILTTNLDGQIKLEGSFDGAFAASTGEKKLYERQFSITSVGGYPLALNFLVNANCDFGANGRAVAFVGAKVNGSLKAGGEYVRDSGTSLVWQPQYPQFQRLGPQLSSSARMEGTCTLSATAKAMVFDQEGPEAVVSTFIKLEVNADGSASTGGSSATADAKLTSGLDARLGGSLQPFGFHLMDIDSPNFHREWVLFDQQVSVAH